MAARRKVLTGRNQKIRVGGTELSRLGLGPDSDELVESLRQKIALEPLTRHEADAHKGRLQSLGKAEKELVMKVLGRKGECTAGALAQFVSMEPGVREFRTRKFIDSVWTEGRWKKEIEGGQLRGSTLQSRAQMIEAELDYWEEAARKASGTLGLRAPTAEEKLAALQPSELSEHHKRFIRLMPDRGHRAVDAEDLDAFRGWVSGLKGRAGERLWRASDPEVFTLASLMHRICYSSKLDFTVEEIRLLRSVFGEEAVPDLTILKKAFISGFKEKAQWEMLAEIRKVVWEHAEDGLLNSARSSAEYRTMMEFLGLPLAAVAARIRPGRGYCMGSRNMSGNHSTNDDNFTSLDITSGGRAIRLDAVFDGVSGHNGGYIASGLAKETIEIAAMAGWISSPEDVRVAVILADLVVNMEKMRYSHKRMGSTASVSYISGSDFYGITCGDSPLKAIRGEKVIFSSNPHGVGNRLFSALGIGPMQIDINNSPGRQFAPISLRSGDWVLAFTDGLGDVTCDHEHAIVLDGLKSPKKAALALVALADPRRDGEEKYKLLCSCEPKEGKDDDIALVPVYIE